jgi:hypothetical protein
VRIKDGGGVDAAGRSATRTGGGIDAQQVDSQAADEVQARRHRVLVPRPATIPKLDAAVIRPGGFAEMPSRCSIRLARINIAWNDGWRNNGRGPDPSTAREVAMTASSAKDSEAGGSPPTEPAEPAEASEPDPDAPVTASAKDAFAAALARKNAAGAKRAAHLDAHGGVGGSTASHKTSRTFRRKSG